MLKKALFLYLTLMVYSTGIGATPNLDSLKQVVETMPEDSLKCQTLLEIVHLLYAGDEAELYGHQALVLAKQLKMPALIAASYQRLSWSLTYDEMDKKTAYLDSASIIYNEIGDKRGLALVYNTRGIIMMEYGKLEEGQAFFQKAYRLYVSLGDKEKQATMLNNWAIAHNMMEQPLKAIEKLQKALDFRLGEQPESPIELGRIYFNLAQATEQLGNFNLAMDYYISSYQHRKKVNNIGVAESFMEMATIVYKAATQKKDTLNLLKKIQMLGIPHSYALLDSVLQMPGIEGRVGFKYDNLNVRRKRHVLYKNYRSAYYLLSDLKKMDEDYKLSSSSLAAFADLKIQFEKERLKTRLLEEEIINEKKQHQVNLLLFSLGLVLSLLFMGFWSYQNRLKANRLQLAMEKEKVAKAKQEQQIVAMRSMLEGQEKERARIARDLHDGLGNLLSSIKVSVGSMELSFNHNLTSQKMYHKASEMIDEACTEVRKIAHEMMPQALKRLGLKKALEDLCRKMDNTHAFEVHFYLYGKEQILNDNTNVMIYRMVQELFNNIVKYAEAKEVLLQLTFSEKWLNLTIEDDGKGFEIDKITDGTGMGLKSIDFRSHYVGGHYEIDSRLGMGTLVTINVPLVEKNEE